jgi:hypothetical protein
MTPSRLLKNSFNSLRPHSICRAAPGCARRGLLSQAPLPRRERSLGTKPVFTQGVESEGHLISIFWKFLSTLLSVASNAAQITRG